MFFKSVQIRSKEPTFLDALASICLSLTEGMFGISSVVSRSLDGLVVNHDDPSPEWAGLSSQLNGLTQECSIFLSKQATIYNFMQNKMLEINLWKEKQNIGMMMEITVLKMRLVHVASICLILLEPVAPLFSDFFFPFSSRADWTRMHMSKGSSESNRSRNHLVLESKKKLLH